MFENPSNLFQNVPTHQGQTPNLHAYQYNTALNQFKSALVKGRFFRIKARVLHRQPFLYDLNEIKSGLHLRGSSYMGIKVVRIDSIIGSEGRASDFDMGFHPLREASRERWINMAIAFLSRVPLPPIQLVEIGGAYFLRDGHHRVSVARAFGQVAMDAEIIAWNAAPPFPWQLDAAFEKTSSLKSVKVSP